MTTHPAISRLDVADMTTVQHAAALLAEANRVHPADRLPGSAAVTRSRLGADEFRDLLVIAKHLGRVDLVHDKGRIAGVACWILHPAQQSTRTVGILDPERLRTRPFSAGERGPCLAVSDGLDRMHLLDRVLGVPDRTHVHLSCIGTRPGYDARMFADLLICHQNQLADHCRHTVYAEAHSPADQGWLHRSGGYVNCGTSLEVPREPPSYAMARTPGARSPA